MKKKVLLIDVSDVGLYNFRKELVEELIKNDFEVHFSVPFGSKVAPIEALEAIYHQIELQRRGKNPFSDIKLIRAYRKLIRNTNPSLVITRALKPNIYAGLMARSLRIPYISLITGLGTGFNKGGILRKILYNAYKSALKKSRCVFFQNERDIDCFKGFLDIKEIKYVLTKGSGVDTEKYSRSQSPNNSEDKCSDVKFLFIARIQREKGIEEYLKAAEHFTSRIENCVFSVLGSFEEEHYRERITDLASKGIISYLGVSEDTRVEMLNADCIVLPSFYREGMSNVLLEGASMELPVITSSNYGCREAVENGVTGFICEGGNTESLINAIDCFIRLTVEERVQMGTRGRQKMKNEFERALVVRQYMEIVCEVIGN